MYLEVSEHEISKNISSANKKLTLKVKEDCINILKKHDDSIDTHEISAKIEKERNKKEAEAKMKKEYERAESLLEKYDNIEIERNFGVYYFIYRGEKIETTKINTREDILNWTDTVIKKTFDKNKKTKKRSTTKNYNKQNKNINPQITRKKALTKEERELVKILSQELNKQDKIRNQYNSIIQKEINEKKHITETLNNIKEKIKFQKTVIDRLEASIKTAEETIEEFKKDDGNTGLEIKNNLEKIKKSKLKEENTQRENQKEQKLYEKELLNINKQIDELYNKRKKLNEKIKNNKQRVMKMGVELKTNSEKINRYKFIAGQALYHTIMIPKYIFDEFKS